MDILNRQDEQDFLKSYVPEAYESPSVTADMLVFTMDEKQKNYRELPEKELQILMIKRGGYPYKNCWAIPGGFAAMNETLEQSAKRELLEEAGLDNVYMEQLYTWGDVDRDPRKRVISVSYMALVSKDSLKVKAGDDADDAKFFTIKLKQMSKLSSENGSVVTDYQLLLVAEENEEKICLSSVIRSIKRVRGTGISEKISIIDSDIAFDHAKIIYYAVMRLRNKLDYTTIAFNLLPEEFTIGELQQVYETIMAKELIAPNFRRKMMPLLEDTGKMEPEKMGHRPSKMYRLKIAKLDNTEL